MKYYIVIWEDFSVKHFTELSEDYIQASIEGICEIIDITDPSNPLQHDGANFVPLT